MPEGDTIFRTASSLRTWLVGRTVTNIETPWPRSTANERADLQRLVGHTVTSVTATGKNLFVHFDSLVLHTHMRMTGSWHVYESSATWQRPKHQARIVITCTDRLAVCFNVPILALSTLEDLNRDSSIANLGPDILVDPFDMSKVVKRAYENNDTRAIGEVLLDQSVVSGIGNIYRCESLFLERVDPWAVLDTVDRETFEATVHTASQLMRENATGTIGRDFGRGDNNAWVYGRAGLPCRVCQTPVRTKRLGSQARIVFWCGRCQPPK
jgi:endonuclease VIII